MKICFRNVSSSCLKYPIEVNNKGDPIGSDTEERFIWTMQIAGVIIEAHLKKSCNRHCGQNVFSIVHYNETQSQVNKNLL